MPQIRSEKQERTLLRACGARYAFSGLRNCIPGRFQSSCALHGGDDLLRHELQLPELIGRQHARPDVYDAQRSERLAIAGDQRRPRVKPDVGIAGNERIAGKPLVNRRIRHDKHIAGRFDGVGAKAMLLWRCSGVQTNAGLEPLAFVVNQRNKRNGRVAHAGCQPRDVVIGCFLRGVHHFEGAQGG